MTDEKAFLSSNTENPLLLPGDAFAAKFKREPSSASDCAWMNGYAARMAETSGALSMTERDAWKRELELAVDELHAAGLAMEAAAHSNWMDRAEARAISGKPSSPSETTARPDLSEIATVVQAAAKHVESILARPGPYHPAFTALLELADRFKAPRPLVCPDGWRCKYPRLVGSIAQDCEYPNCDCGPPEKASGEPKP